MGGSGKDDVTRSGAFTANVSANADIEAGNVGAVDVEEAAADGCVAGVSVVAIQSLGPRANFFEIEKGTITIGVLDRSTEDTRSIINTEAQSDSRAGSTGASDSNSTVAIEGINDNV